MADYFIKASGSLRTAFLEAHACVIFDNQRLGSLTRKRLVRFVTCEVFFVNYAAVFLPSSSCNCFLALFGESNARILAISENGFHVKVLILFYYPLTHRRHGCDFVRRIVRIDRCRGALRFKAAERVGPLENCLVYFVFFLIILTCCGRAWLELCILRGLVGSLMHISALGFI